MAQSCSAGGKDPGPPFGSDSRNRRCSILGVPELLRKAMPVQADLLFDPSPWPQNNEKDESELRQALLALENSTPAKARARVLELEKLHGPRRAWVWAKLGQAPLANALDHAGCACRTCSNQTRRRIHGRDGQAIHRCGLGGRYRRAVCDGRGEVVCRCTGGGQSAERCLPALVGVGG